MIELFVRISGITDFPIYLTSSDFGYMPAPSQSGSFLHRNDWVFNELSMGTERPWHPQGQKNLLLIGNSIVFGGNPYGQDDRLGPLLQAQLGTAVTVWPIAAGRWSNVNEAVYLRFHPNVARAADAFVWEYMAGGLSRMSSWQGELLFPDHRPLWRTEYVARRYLLPRLFGYSLVEVQPEGPPTVDNVAIFNSTLTLLTSARGPNQIGMLLLYPSQAELKRARSGAEWLPERAEVERLAGAYQLRLVDLAQVPAWNALLYRDGTHPTIEGNRILASIIADALAH